MNPAFRQVVLFGLLAVLAAVVGIALANRTPQSTLTVESRSEPPLPTASASAPATEIADTSCGEVVTATRPYGRVIVGRQLETLLPSVGQLIVIDPEEGPGPLRLRAEHRQGPGKLQFDDFGEPSQTTVLRADSQRTSPGWPDHWGVDATVTGPGCWRLHVRGPGINDRLIFRVSRADWRRVWRHKS